MRPSVASRGFTMIEVVVVAGAVAALMAILLPVIGMVRKAVAVRTATQVVTQIEQAIASYRTEDARHRFPPVNADISLSFRGVPGPEPGPLGRLETLGLYFDGSQPRDADSRLLDPWKHPYRYALVRPAPANPSGALQDWNWDVAASHERAWGDRPDPVTNDVAAGPLLYAYVWSLGPAGDGTDARTWIYTPDPSTR
jgi:type II secretory pathway pseudopilin PulG